MNGVYVYQFVKIFQTDIEYRKYSSAIELYSLARITWLKHFLFWTTEALDKAHFFQSGKRTANGFALGMGQLVDQDKQAFQLAFLKNFPVGLTVQGPNYSN